MLILHLHSFACSRRMKYLDYDQLDSIHVENFKTRKPFPWVNPAGVLKQDALHHLLEHLPDISMFEKRSAYSRKHGQKGHQRWSLEYAPELDIDKSWHEFVSELQQAGYRQFLRRLYGYRPIKLSFHWHYTARGGTVSPHCDSKRKIGSHVFYLNTEENWKPEWGGQTLILNDRGRFNCNSAPEFEDFDDTVAADCIGNRSMIFRRTSHSWHGVEAINCPADRMRKVFIVVIERLRLIRSVKDRFKKNNRQAVT